MLPALVSLKGLVRPKSYHIDHLFFRLHYQVTVCLLLGFCLALTAKVLFGDVIDCKSRALGRDQYYDNWCFSRGTFTELVPDIEALDEALKRVKTANKSEVMKPKLIQTTTEPPSWLGRQVSSLAGLALTHLFNETEEPQPTTLAPELPPSPSPSQQPVEQLPPLTPQMLLRTDGVYNNQNSNHEEEVQIPYGLVNRTQQADQTMWWKSLFKTVHRFVKTSGVGVSYNIAYMLPGIPVPNGRGEEHFIKFHHTYYQYIPVILFLQAVCFYAPHYLWKVWENGVVASVCKQIYDHRFSPSDYFDTNYYIIDYLQNAFFTNRTLVYKYYFCHLLMLVNVIAQIIILNSILNNQFITYGLDMIEYTFIDEDVYGLRDFFTAKPENLNNPMDFIFPKVTNCRFINLGDGGSPNELNFACVLPLNMFHDKFFLILWFWLLLLTILSTMQIIFDILYAFLPRLRRQLFIRRFGPMLRNKERHPTSLTELFLLDLIGNSSDKFAFAALLRKLNKEERQSLV